MIKIYEIVRQNHARLIFSYCNCTIPVDFTGGNMTMGQGGLFRTNNRFIQDAIEKDNRYGVTIRLKGTVKEEGDDQPQQHPQVKKQTKKTESKEKDKKGEEWITFKTEADAVYYLEQELEIDVTGMDDERLKAIMRANRLKIG